MAVTVEVVPARLDDPDVLELIDLIQGEYVVRYGGPDGAPIDVAEFLLPAGLFLLATVDGAPAGCGGWRALGGGRAEIKRMFTVAGYRNRGVARAGRHRPPWSSAAPPRLTQRH